MKSRLTYVSLTIFLSLMIVTGSVIAEVSVVVDGKGDYVNTLLLFNKSRGHIYYWEPVRKGIPSYLMLNIEGDLVGDSKPSLAEHPLNKLPCVVWSRFNGENHSIIHSRWDGNVWTAPVPLFESQNNDIEATIAFEPSGIPFIAFTRKSETSRIYVTAFLNGRWIGPFLTSDPTINCFSPALIFKNDISAVAFITPDGIKIVLLDDIPTYETRDIEEGPNPLPEFIPGSGGGTGGFHGGKEK